jgi:hypothetical protein
VNNNAQRKVLLTLLAAAIAVLARDQLVRGPSNAQAERPTPAAPVAERSIPPLARTESEQPVDQQPLLHRMKALSEAADLDRIATLDAFKPPADWLPEVKLAEPLPTPEDQRVEQFKRHHKLSAVVTGPAGQCAVIAGRTLMVGQQLDGFVLVSIGDRSALFKMNDLEVVLSISDRSGTDRK